MTTWDEVAHDSRYSKVLDHGFVGLVDHMGSDQAIVQAARVSYGAGTKSVNEDRGLIRYLLRKMHSTPFEMVEFKFHLKMPIFVMRQHVRHRMATVNEYSGRYSIMTDEFYIPEPSRLQTQSSLNKQGSGETLEGQELEMAMNTIQRVSGESYLDYLSLINDPNGRGYNLGDREGLARELARMVLPLNNYTELYWKIDLKNLFHYLNLRADSHSQYEIQMVAAPIAEHVKRICPVAWEAFEDYWSGAETVSRLEKLLLAALIQHSNTRDLSFAESYDILVEEAGGKPLLRHQFGMSKRELTEFETRWELD
jgi:thymidylate synthase (FAD)